MEWQMAFELMIIYSPLYKLTDTGSTPVIKSRFRDSFLFAAQRDEVPIALYGYS